MAKCNISFFIPHLGCPHKCSFCNQNSITGQSAGNIPHKEDIEKTLKKAICEIDDKDKNITEIAYFGGSFTAIKREYMLELLDAAQPFIGKGKFAGIRISTRPDCIDEEILHILKSHHVTAIELGCQSMNDTVLKANERGHSREDVIKASKLIKEFNIKLGLQMMVGLYMSTPEIDMYTANEILKLSPEEVRIYPVVIMENTKLGSLFKSGEYIPYDFKDAVKLSSQILSLFEQNGISVIKLGLHASEVVKKDCIGGFYHPAFRELCESEIYKNKIEDMLKKTKADIDRVIVSVNPKIVSKVIGQKRSNIEYFENKGISLKVTQNDKQEEDIKIVEIH